MYMYSLFFVITERGQSHTKYLQSWIVSRPSFDMKIQILLFVLSSLWIIAHSQDTSPWSNTSNQASTHLCVLQCIGKIIIEELGSLSRIMFADATIITTPNTQCCRQHADNSFNIIDKLHVANFKISGEGECSLSQPHYLSPEI